MMYTIRVQRKGSGLRTVFRGGRGLNIGYELNEELRMKKEVCRLDLEVGQRCARPIIKKIATK